MQIRNRAKSEFSNRLVIGPKKAFFGSKGHFRIEYSPSIFNHIEEWIGILVPKNLKIHLNLSNALRVRNL